MAQELLYTSAPRGLTGASLGYTTVARTRGMSQQLTALLEKCSSYKRFAAAEMTRPVKFLHLHLKVGGSSVHVLSRIAEVEAEFTGRDNFLAHHVVLGEDELPKGGPAWLLRRPDFFRTEWDGNVGEYPHPRDVPEGDRPPRPCKAWEAWAGDAGWAGVLADAFANTPQRGIYLLYDLTRGEDVPALLEEAIALLPPSQRWSVTFSTLQEQPNAPYQCVCRCLPRDSEEARRLAHDPGRALVLDLSSELGEAPDGPFVQQARTGVAKPERAAAAPRARAVAPVPAAEAAPAAWPAPVNHGAAPPREAARPVPVASSEPPPPPTPPVPQTSFTGWLARGMIALVVLVIIGTLSAVSLILYSQQQRAVAEAADLENEKAELVASLNKTKGDVARLTETQKKLLADSKEEAAKAGKLAGALKDALARADAADGEVQRLESLLRKLKTPAAAPDKEAAAELKRLRDEVGALTTRLKGLEAARPYKYVARHIRIDIDPKKSEQIGEFRAGDSAGADDLAAVGDDYQLEAVLFPKQLLDLREAAQFREVIGGDKKRTVTFESGTGGNDPTFKPLGSVTLDRVNLLTIAWQKDLPAELQKQKNDFARLFKWCVLKAKNDKGQVAYISMFRPQEKVADLGTVHAMPVDVAQEVVVEAEGRFREAGEPKKRDEVVPVTTAAVGNSVSQRASRLAIYRVMAEEKVRVDLLVQGQK